MKFPLAWLRRHLDTDASATAITEKMTAIGLEVEHIRDMRAELADIRLARIEKVEKHPNADRLSVCSVQDGRGQHAVVCGAANVRPALMVAFAAPGAFIPAWQDSLRKARIRGVDSAGMLCSAAELGIGTDSDGIMEIDTALAPGVPLADALKGLDVVITIEVTPNRPDAAGVRGIARDLAAAGMGRLREDLAPDLPPAKNKTQHKLATIDDNALEACPQFGLRSIKGVTNRESPVWLRSLLLHAGLRPISALVDITNFLTLDRCRPLHVYDAAKVALPMHIRMGRADESFLALDQKRYTVGASDCVIADQNTMLGLGGLIGGSESGCGPDTRDILLECAAFNPLHVARSGRRLGIESNARYRFERGIDAHALPFDLDLATRMILDLCGGTIATTHFCTNAPPPRQAVPFSPASVRKLIGVAPANNVMLEMLEKLECKVDARDPSCWLVRAPGFRHDLNGAEDLIEEIARLHGYAAIPRLSMPAPERAPAIAAKVQKASPFTRSEKENLARAAAAFLGYDEIISLAFCSKGMAEAFKAPQQRLVALRNPLSSDKDHVRPNPLPGLAEALLLHRSYAQKPFKAFEIGAAYAIEGEKGKNEEETQVPVLCAMLDPAGTPHWQPQRASEDIFTLKADLERILEAWNMPMPQIRNGSDYGFFHPHRCARLLLGPKRELGCFGQIHPACAALTGLPTDLLLLMLYIDAVPAKKPAVRPAFLKRRTPFSERDFAFILPETVAAGDALATVIKQARPFAEDVFIFDLYKGDLIGSGNKSLAFRLCLRDPRRTLSQEELEALSGKIVEAMQRTHHAKLRDGRSD